MSVSDDSNRPASPGSVSDADSEPQHQPDHQAHIASDDGDPQSDTHHESHIPNVSDRETQSNPDNPDNPDNPEISHQSADNHNPNLSEEEEEDIDIDADINPTNDTTINATPPQPDEAEDEELGDDLMGELFGSDEDGADSENHTSTTQQTVPQKVLSREYKRSVPQGKKLNLSTSLNLSTLPQSADYEFCIVRLPNVVGCDMEAFDESSYVAPSSSDYDNYIRWRTHYDEALGETFKESNTRLVYWKDGTKSLLIGKECYDIDEHMLTGSRDYIYAQMAEHSQPSSSVSYKMCHGQFMKRLNVKASSEKSYRILQKNLAKKHERTKGSMQLTAGQRRKNNLRNEMNNRKYGRGGSRGGGRGGLGGVKKQRGTRKRSLKESWLEQGGHGDDSSDDNGGRGMRKRQKTSEDDSGSEESGSGSGSEEESGSASGSGSESEEDDDDDDMPIGNRL